VPGYLELNPDKDLSFNVVNFQDIRIGGTAKIIRANLTNTQFISQCGTADVAVKLFPNASQDFLYEVAIMAALPASPLICKFVGFSAQAFPFIVLKFYPDSLVSFYEELSFKPSTRIIRKAAYQIASGLQLLHNHNIIHLDVKPGKPHIM
jgi:serine/threonine protein kinase